MNKFVNNVKTMMLLAMMTALILVIGGMVGGQNGLMFALVIAGVMNFVAFFFSDKIALRTMRAQQVGPDHDLYKIVQSLAVKANMPMPRVYVAPTQAPNAFATGRNPKNAAVCATAGLFQLLNRNEIAAVMAHELAHVKNRDILIQSIAITIGAAISILGYMQMFGGRDRNAHPLLVLLVLIVGPLAAGLIQAAISRSREYNADTGGAEIWGNPHDLVSALRKIHAYAGQIPMQVSPAFNSMFIAEPLNAMHGAAGLFQTHPPLEARIKNLLS